jgi:hypothetical protein
MQRKYRIVHEQYLVEWAARNYPPGTWRTNVRLGTPHPELIKTTLKPELQRMFMLTVPQADLVATLPDRVDIVEALVRPEWYKVSQLWAYGKLFPLTLEYKEHWHKPIRLVLLTAIVNPFYEWIAHEWGIDVVHYRPDWLETYITSLAPRKQQPPYIIPPVSAK